MRLNYETVIVGNHCILVPYRPQHVERYHGWMQDPTLLEATGSEPLSLNEECEMQVSWRDDDTKCTFIVLERALLDEVDEKRLSDAAMSNLDDGFIERSLGAMVGDVNLFLSEEDDGDEHSECNELEHGATTEEQLDHNMVAPETTSTVRRVHVQAELDIMVAEKSARGKGLGREACCLMMLYGAKYLSIRRFFCKINEDNEASLGLFLHKLDFQQRDYVACFRQVELDLKEQSPSTLFDKLLSVLGSPSGLRIIRLTTSSFGDDSKC